MVRLDTGPAAAAARRSAARRWSLPRRRRRDRRHRARGSPSTATSSSPTSSRSPSTPTASTTRSPAPSPPTSTRCRSPTGIVRRRDVHHRAVPPGGAIAGPRRRRAGPRAAAGRACCASRSPACGVCGGPMTASRTRPAVLARATSPGWSSAPGSSSSARPARTRSSSHRRPRRSLLERGESSSDLDRNAGGLGGALGATASVERRVLRRVDLPAGLSVHAIGRRRDDADRASLRAQQPYLAQIALAARWRPLERNTAKTGRMAAPAVPTSDRSIDPRRDLGDAQRAPQRPARARRDGPGPRRARLDRHPPGAARRRRLRHPRDGRGADLRGQAPRSAGHRDQGPGPRHRRRLRRRVRTRVRLDVAAPARHDGLRRAARRHPAPDARAGQARR